MEETKLVPCAIWSNDCQGKKDFDGRLLGISCRCWPGPEGQVGFNSFDSSTGKFSTVPYGPKPSANASIHIEHGEPDEPDGYGDSTELVSAEFEADTEAEVKSLVEAWVTAKVNEIASVLTAHFATTKEGGEG